MEHSEESRKFDLPWQGYLANVCPSIWDANQDLSRLRVQLNIQAFPHAAQKHIGKISKCPSDIMTVLLKVPLLVTSVPLK